MFKTKEKQKLKIRDIRLKNKLEISNNYYWLYIIFLSIFFFLLSPIKKYIVLSRNKYSKWFWIVSYSIFSLFWYKWWYIDDFIVSEKLRWKWVWIKLFDNVLNKIKNNNCDIAFLVWHIKRKESHNLYRKFWFSVISLGLFIFAYKKIKKK